jgi:hypothetical protein
LKQEYGADRQERDFPLLNSRVTDYDEGKGTFKLNVGNDVIVDGRILALGQVDEFEYKNILIGSLEDGFQVPFNYPIINGVYAWKKADETVKLVRQPQEWAYPRY